MDIAYSRFSSFEQKGMSRLADSDQVKITALAVPGQFGKGYL